MMAGMLMVACVFALGADLPKGLEELPALRMDEAALIQAMRAFDVREAALADAELKEAQEKAAAGDTEAAETKRQSAIDRFKAIRQGYEYVLRQYPSNARGQNYYGELLYDRFGEIAGAVRAWELASSLDPKFSAPFNNLAIHHCHTGNYAQGLYCYDRALSLDPDMADYRYNLAQMYLVNFPEVQKLRKWDKAKVYREAMKLSKRAKELAPDDFDIVQDYAVNFFAGGDFGVKINWKDAAKAWQDTRAIARTDEERFYAWLNEARVWIRAEDRSRAAACLEEALRIRPDSAVAKKLQADLGPPPEKSGKMHAKEPAKRRE
ncbi:MAG TPA: tetratricopeptide repeat protein [Candidatus Hydrogenedentes bacterium]|nr:tetratricopeptide repeat protein [Candidatus Hydrogenedentota bacterium]HOV73238.1 tetratricopeptide repeat protein [Candidatus Hydrogenedentota bacterium]HPC17464.1 tetratricopeptide repeat protein [Candidatus Hydrogenedentota bacterium]HRT20056.1 tetratricopeptide repeat protein [Candidatus Hydrogenedentota bacterium]HRT64880.1 tetratricopeptide repeat protein [Candidatus Hydrogenedentota bacterium]